MADGIMPASPSLAATATRAVPIVALDVPNAFAAKRLVDQLGSSARFFKVGLELFTAEGPAIVDWLRASGKQVFLDLKLHDIPNTVAAAAHRAAQHGASLLTVHASGGSSMISAAVEGAGASCGILGVSILTSLDGIAVGEAWGREIVDVSTEVQRLAQVTQRAGARGVVCSGHEAAAVRAARGDEFGILVPGIRLPGGEAHDQKRIMTPRDAADAGANWLILGRAVTAAADPAAAMATVVASLK